MLPNNKNIVPVAEQVDALTDQDGRGRADPSDGRRRSPRCSPTTRRPSADDNAAAMAEAARRVRGRRGHAGGRATAIAESGRSPTGDWLGIVRGDGIVVVATSAADGARSRCSTQLVDDDREIVTVIDGAERRRRPTPRASREWLGRHHPDVEVEVHDGGQPLYPYLVGVE